MRDLLRLILLGLIVAAFVGGFILSSLRNERGGPVANPLTMENINQDNADESGPEPEQEISGSGQDGHGFFVDMA